MSNWIPIDGEHELPEDGQQCFITVWEDWSYGDGTQISINVDWGKYSLGDSYININDNGDGFNTYNDWKEGQPVKILAWMPIEENCGIDELFGDEFFELLDSIEPYDEMEINNENIN
jgi:hypothetical protein